VLNFIYINGSIRRCEMRLTKKAKAVLGFGVAIGGCVGAMVTTAIICGGAAALATEKFVRLMDEAHAEDQLKYGVKTEWEDGRVEEHRFRTQEELDQYIAGRNASYANAN